MMAKITEKDLKTWLAQRAHPKGKSVGDGLIFRVSPQGQATWALRYRFNGMPRYLPLGRYPAVSLEAAKVSAKKAWARIYDGVDVAREKHRERIEARGAISFSELAADYLQRTGKTLVERSQQEVRRFLKKDLEPELGDLAARDIRAGHVVDLVEKVGKRSDPVARRCFGLLSIIFAHGVAKGAIPANPCAGLDLTAILGPRPPSRPRIKLSREELSFALASFTTLGPVLSLACKILLATCVRKSELLHARKTDVDSQNGVWTVYAKGGKTYVVPLAPTVAGWFRELMALAGDSAWILPAQQRRGRYRNPEFGRPDGNHMGRSTLNAALKRLDKRVREFAPHDLRSTARSYLAELGVNIIVAERCLNHTLGGLVAVYDQHDYLNERREALEKWANLLAELEGKPDNVVPLRAAA